MKRPPKRPRPQPKSDFMSVEVFRSLEPDALPSRQFVAVIDWNGYRGNFGMATFVFGQTEDEARRKGRAWIEETVPAPKSDEAEPDTMEAI